MAGNEERPGILGRLRKAVDQAIHVEDEDLMPPGSPSGSGAAGPNMSSVAAIPHVVVSPTSAQPSDSPLYREFSRKLSEQKDAMAAFQQSWDILEAVSNPRERLAAALKMLKTQGYKPSDVAQAIDARVALLNAEATRVRERGLPARRDEAKNLRQQSGSYDGQQEKIRGQIGDLERQIEDLRSKQRQLTTDAERIEEQVAAIEADLSQVLERMTQELQAQKAQFLGV